MHQRQFYVKPDTHQITVTESNVKKLLERDNLTLNQLILETGCSREQVQEAVRRLETKQQVRYQNKHWELMI